MSKANKPKAPRTPTRQRDLDGPALIRMMSAATAWLERHASSVNALNVFPVPDGDTGTNMLLTMRSTLEEARKNGSANAGAVAKAMATGALMGARGNSGVILSQIMRGLAKGMEEKERCAGADLIAGLKQASDLAVRALSQPVEGTLITVIRDVAQATEQRAADGDVADVLEAAVEAAATSVARTPELLPVLKEAGVVDAGGEGLRVLLEGALRSLRGEATLAEVGTPEAPTHPQGTPSRVPADRGYGYCTEFLLRGTALDHTSIRQRMNSLGDSVIVVGDDTLVKVHLHAFDPGAALSFAVTHGALQDIKIDNIDEQHKEYAATVKHKPVHAAFAAVAVANGEGLIKVLRSLGAAVVEGGQTMNPSAQDLLRAVESAPSDTVVILPNNPNIVLTANLVPGLTKKRVAVLPTHSIPQGIAALVAMNPSLGLDSNLPAMQRAVRDIATIEVCTSIRSASVGGVRVKKGQPIGLLNGDLVAAGDTPVEVLCSVLARATMSDGALVTIYYGTGVSPETVEHAFQTVRRRYPKQEVELVHGGQPHYAFLVSVE